MKDKAEADWAETTNVELCNKEFVLISIKKLVIE